MDSSNSSNSSAAGRTSPKSDNAPANRGRGQGQGMPAPSSAAAAAATSGPGSTSGSTTGTAAATTNSRPTLQPHTVTTVGQATATAAASAANAAAKVAPPPVPERQMPRMGTWIPVVRKGKAKASGSSSAAAAPAPQRPDVARIRAVNPKLHLTLAPPHSVKPKDPSKKAKGKSKAKNQPEPAPGQVDDQPQDKPRNARTLPASVEPTPKPLWPSICDKLVLRILTLADKTAVIKAADSLPETIATKHKHLQTLKRRHRARKLVRNATTVAQDGATKKQQQLRKPLQAQDPDPHAMDVDKDDEDESMDVDKVTNEARFKKPHDPVLDELALVFRTFDDLDSQGQEDVKSKVKTFRAENKKPDGKVDESAARREQARLLKKLSADLSAKEASLHTIIAVEFGTTEEAVCVLTS